MGFEPTTLHVMTPMTLARQRVQSVTQRLEHPIQNTEGGGFESHLGLRFFLCPLMADSLHLPLFPL